MKRYWEHLKPNERRLVVIVGFVVFIVLNAWFVWPHFTDLRRDIARMQAANVKLATYRATLAHKAEYEAAIRKLEEGSGSQVVQEDQAIDLLRFSDKCAIDNSVQIQNNSGIKTKTTDFFLEQEMTLNVIAKEKGLVGFLYSLGSGNSMVRVRNMSLRPDQSHQQLSATITLVASYQKNPPAKSAAPTPETKIVASARPAPAVARPEPTNPNPQTTNSKLVAPDSKLPAATNRSEPRFLKPAGTNKPSH